MYVIIGAGPAGLFTALKLREAGLINIVIYDPRLNQYTRPGHLNKEVYQKAETSLNISFWPKDKKLGHIKDLERELYKEAEKRQIKMEQKQFIRLHQDKSTPGVVIANDEGIEEIIPAHYVFDCSGSKRVVVHEVNRLVPESPMKIATITDIPAPNHFLAYVKLDYDKLLKLINLRTTKRDAFPHTDTALQYAQHLMKLRDLGWKQVTFPNCYGMPFGKNQEKACLYMECVENLSTENQEAWVQTVLNCYLPDVTYERIPSFSRKYGTKPRFTPFIITANELQQVSFKGKQLPTVIALGDAQIDPNYELAHGIFNGISRINTLINNLIIFDNKIQYFDAEEYQSGIRADIQKHKDQIIKKSRQVKSHFNDRLDEAQLKLREAILMSMDRGEKETINVLLKEVEARQHFQKARHLFNALHHADKQLKRSQPKLTEMLSELESLHNHLIKALENLPQAFAAERHDTENLLILLASSWKDLGNDLFSAKRFPETLDSYKKSLDIYNLPVFQGKFLEKELLVYSNMVIVYFNKNNYAESIAAANIGLTIYETSPKTENTFKLYEKIVYNLIRSLYSQASLLIDNQLEEANNLHNNALDLFQLHREKISAQTIDRIHSILQTFEANLEAHSNSNKDDEEDDRNYSPPRSS